MTSSPRLKFLKQLLGVQEQRCEGKEKEMKETEESNEVKQEIIPKEKSLDISKTFKSEFNFLKFPFFDLSARASKKDRIEIREIEETEDEKIEILWQVSRNIDSDFPSAFARKVHKEVVEQTLNNMKRPVPRLIKLGSLRQVCKTMRISPSGANCNEIKRALENIKSAKIKTKGTFRNKEKSGRKKYHEGVFNLYDMVFFTGETLPDGTEADSVYILLNDMYVKNFNYNYVVPLDYHYLHSLEGDIASRMYEIFSVWFYPALENGRDYIDREYSELCDYFPLTKQNIKWKAKGQLKKAHYQHILNGFLASEPEWTDIGKKDNWLIRYWIGEKAKEWHYQNKKMGTSEEVKQIEEKLPKKVEKNNGAKEQDNAKINTLVGQLTNLGITPKVAEDLVANKDIGVIEGWTKAVYETKAKDKAAFVVKAIEENWELPEVFRKKREEEERQEVLLQKQKEQAELLRQYEEYKKGKMDSYLSQITPEEKKQDLERLKQELYKKYPFARTWGEDTQVLISTLESSFIEEVKEKVKLLPFQDWLEQQKNILNTME